MSFHNHNYMPHVGAYGVVSSPMYPAYRQTNALTYTTTAEPTPFYAPDLSDTLPKWDGEKADIDANWLITHVPDSHKAKSHKELITDPSIGGVFFTPKVHNELTYVVEKLADVTGECAFFVLTKQLSKQRPHWLAYDWFLPKQTASYGEVKINVQDSERYYNHLMEKYPSEFPNSRKLHEKLMHAHSHHRMALCNWSSVDMAQQSSRDELAYQGDYRLFFLFTIGHGIKATLVDYSRVTTRTDMFTGLCFAEPEYCVPLTNKRKRELDERMLKLVSKTTYVTPGLTFQTKPGVITTPTYVANTLTTKDEMIDEYASFEWEDAVYGGAEHIVKGVTKNPPKAPAYKTRVYDMLLETQKPAFENAAAELVAAVTNTIVGFGVCAEVDLRELKWMDKIAAAVRFEEMFVDMFPFAPTQETKNIIRKLEIALVECFVSTVTSEYIDDGDFNTVFDLPNLELKDLIDRATGIVENLVTWVGESATLYVLRESAGGISETILDNWFETDVLTFQCMPEDLELISQAITSPDDVDLTEIIAEMTV